MTLVPVAQGEYLSPAGRMRRIGETRAVLGDPGLFDPLRFWTDHGVLAIPGLDEVPQWRRHDRAAARRYIARADWKERCKRKRRVSSRTRRIVIERAGSRCEYCGDRLAATELEVDHVLPVTRGGRSYLANLAAACRTCNFDKFDQLIEEWLPGYQDRVFEYRLQKVREIFPDAFRSAAA
jgi:5-methylcytosine-specific restriction endonuclease McrA